MSDQLDIFRDQPADRERAARDYDGIICVCGEINTRHCPVHGQGSVVRQLTELPGETFEDIFGGEAA